MPVASSLLGKLSQMKLFVSHILLVWHSNGAGCHGPFYTIAWLSFLYFQGDQEQNLGSQLNRRLLKVLESFGEQIQCKCSPTPPHAFLLGNKIKLQSVVIFPNCERFPHTFLRMRQRYDCFVINPEGLDLEGLSVAVYKQFAGVFRFRSSESFCHYRPSSW